MTRRNFSFLVLVGLLLCVGMNDAYSQLLEDRNKLKTSERTRKPFFKFKKNIKQPKKTNQKPNVVKQWSIPTSKEKAGDQGGHNIQPKYSEKRTYSLKYRIFQPRYTQDNAGKYKVKPFTPRYTQENAGFYKIKPFTPRFSQENAGKFDGRTREPRYSQRDAKDYKIKKIAPRFTQPGLHVYKKVAIIPRTTQERAGQGYEKWRANPRYTIRDPKDFKIVKIQPRFSTPPDYVSNPIGGRKKGFIPAFQFNKQKARYKQGDEPNAFGPKVEVVYPPSNSVAKYNKTIESYQRHISKRGKKSPHAKQTEFFGPAVKVVYGPSNSVAKYNKSIESYQKHLTKGGKKSPHEKQAEFFGPSVRAVYSPSHSVAKHNKSIDSYQRYITRSRKKSPYAKQTEFFGPKVKAVYSPSHSMARYNKTLASYQKYISRSSKKSPYAEQTEYLAKMKKMKKVKNAHPSANYLSAKYDGSPIIRNTKRDVSVTWVRIFGNKTQPKGVRSKVKKAKFDKDEKDIWNNEEREYTR